MKVNLNFLNLIGCPWCAQILDQLKVLLDQTSNNQNISLTKTDLNTREQVNKFKKIVSDKYDLTITSFPAFLITLNQDCGSSLEKSCLMTGSDSIHFLKFLLKEQ